MTFRITHILHVSANVYSHPYVNILATFFLLHSKTVTGAYIAKYF